MILRTTALILMTIGACAAGRASLVTNGGFETGDFSGWQMTTAPDQTDLINLGYLEGVCETGTSFSFTPCTSHSGNYAAALGPNGPSFKLLQDVATTPGMAYTLSFFLKTDNGDPSQTVDNEFDFIFNNQIVQPLSNLASSDYQEYTFTNLVASSASTTFGFGVENVPGGFFLDDITLDPVPEPASTSLVLVALGLLGVGFQKHRTQKATPRAL